MTSATLTDTAADDSFADVSGTLSTTDRDTVDTATYSITGGSLDNSHAGFDHSLDRPADGTLYLNSSSGAYSFVAAAGAIDALQAGDTPSTSFTLNVTDSGNLFDSKTLTIHLVGADDTPTNVVPGAQSTNEDTAKVFSSGNGNLISISDVDNTSHTVTLTAANGAITLNGTTGLSFTVGDGTADGTMTFSGTDANINTALSGLSFLSSPNFNGAASIQIVTTELSACCPTAIR